MIEKKFTKEVNIRLLDKELRAAGFDITWVTYNAGTQEVIIHLMDTETSDPTSIVNAHVFKEDKPIDYKCEYTKSITSDQKLEIIEKMLGLVKLTEQESGDGVITLTK